MYDIVHVHVQLYYLTCASFSLSVGVITPLATRGEREDLDRGRERERGRDRREGDRDLGAGLGEKFTPLLLDVSAHTHMHTL